jgi:hypothetical protein
LIYKRGLSLFNNAVLTRDYLDAIGEKRVKWLRMLSTKGCKDPVLTGLTTILKSPSPHTHTPKKH